MLVVFLSEVLNLKWSIYISLTKKMVNTILFLTIGLGYKNLANGIHISIISEKNF